MFGWFKKRMKATPETAKRIKELEAEGYKRRDDIDTGAGGKFIALVRQNYPPEE